MTKQMIVYNIENWNMQLVFKDLEKGYHINLGQTHNSTQFQIKQTMAVATFTVYSSHPNTYIKQQQKDGRKMKINLEKRGI